MTGRDLAARSAGVSIGVALDPKNWNADGSVRNATEAIAALTARADQLLAGGHPDTAADLLVKAWLALGNRR